MLQRNLWLLYLLLLTLAGTHNSQLFLTSFRVNRIIEFLILHYTLLFTHVATPNLGYATLYGKRVGFSRSVQCMAQINDNVWFQAVFFLNPVKVFCSDSGGFVYIFDAISTTLKSTFDTTQGRVFHILSDGQYQFVVLLA